jgi:hypothetical protein
MKNLAKEKIGLLKEDSYKRKLMGGNLRLKMRRKK